MEGTWTSTARTNAYEADKTEVSDRQVTVRLSTEEQRLLQEAMALTKSQDAQGVLRVALKELVERQRFLNWVAAHDDSRSGTA